MKKNNFNDENSNNTNERILIRNGIEEIKNNHWKLIPIGIYGALTPFALKYLYDLVDKILTFDSTKDLSSIAQDVTTKGIKFIVLPTLATAGLFEVIILIGKCHFNKPDDSKFLNTPLVNQQKHNPIFLYKKKDKNRKHRRNTCL